MGRVARFVVGYGLMIAGILVAIWGLLFVLMGGEGNPTGHPYVGVGAVILAIGVAVVAVSLFVLPSRRFGRRSARPS